MFAGFQPATAERAQISANRHKSSDNLRSSTTPNTHSSPASPSNNSLHRLDPNQPDRPPRSNPHSTRGTASRSLKRGFLHCRLSDAGRQICGAVPQAAGFRNPKQLTSEIPGQSGHALPIFRPPAWATSGSRGFHPLPHLGCSGHSGSPARRNPSSYRATSSARR